MSTWTAIAEKDIEYDPKTGTIDILISSDENGNNYAMVPVELLLDILTEIPDNELP